MVTWLGLGAAFFSAYPAGFWITTVGFAVFVVSSAARPLAALASAFRPWRSWSSGGV